MVGGDAVVLVCLIKSSRVWMTYDQQSTTATLVTTGSSNEDDDQLPDRAQTRLQMPKPTPVIEVPPS